jgi:AcrR family transcriptional regulator
LAKLHDERETEIINVARDLFSRHGYDDTSVQAIIDAVGIAKGTFYHYFNSKEDLLDALIDRLTREARDRLAGEMEVVQGGAAEKLNALARLTSRWKRSEVGPGLAQAMLAALYSPTSLTLRHKLEARSIECFSPIVQRVIDEGIRDGSLHPADPEHAGEAMLLWQAAVAGKVGELALTVGQRPQAAQEIQGWLDASERGTERLLGLPAGSIALYDRQFVGGNLSAIAGKGEKT